MEQRAAESPGEDHSVGVGWEEDPVRRGPTGLRKDPRESAIRGGWKELQAGLPVGAHIWCPQRWSVGEN